MADYLASLVASTLNNTRAKVWSQIWGSHPVYYKLEKNKEPATGGLNIVETLEVGKNPTVAMRDPKTAIPLMESDELKNVAWAWKNLSGSIVIFDEDERVNKGEAAIRNYTKTKIENFKNTMIDTLALQLWKDGGDNAFDGLPAICSATNVYPVADSKTQVTGINRLTAGNEYWKANVYSTAEPFVVFGGTDGGWQKAYDDCLIYAGGGIGRMNDEPDLIVTSQAIFEKFEQSMTDDKRYMNAELAEAGFRNLMFRNAAVVWDPNINSSTSTYILNTKYIKLRPDSACANDFIYDQKHRIEDMFASRILASWAGNITCTYPRKQALVSNKS